MASRKVWNFQLLPIIPDLVGGGYRIDEVGLRIENLVGDILPYRLKFHKVVKLVVCLGRKPGGSKEIRYSEVEGIAEIEVPEFDLWAYRKMDSNGKEAALKKVIMEVFRWIIQHHKDAQSFENALIDLKWE